MDRKIYRVQAWGDVSRLDQRWPRVVGQVSAGAQRVLCIGPGDWILVSDGAGIEPIAQDCSVVDVSSALDVVKVEGSRAREILARSCGLDMHPKAFQETSCARTRLAQVPVVVDCVSDAPRFDCYVSRSYASYLRSWLQDAAIE